jgi:hypothetical protein
MKKDMKNQPVEITSFNETLSDVPGLLELDDEALAMACGASTCRDNSGSCSGLSQCTVNNGSCPTLQSCTGNETIQP